MYRGTCRRTRQTVAIKYSAVVCALMFKRESEVYSQLQSHPHPNVCNLLQMKKVGNTACLVFEHALMDLAQFRRRGHLVRMLIPTCSVQIARGIAALHKHHIIHRDIKPNNILVSLGVDGAVFQITDFGLSRVVLADQAKTQQRRLHLTPGLVACVH